MLIQMNISRKSDHGVRTEMFARTAHSIAGIQTAANSIAGIQTAAHSIADIQTAAHSTVQQVYRQLLTVRHSR